MRRGFSGRSIAPFKRVLRARNPRGTFVTSVAALTGAALATIALSQSGPTTYSPHLDPDHGVLRINEPWAPRGSCAHCHSMKTPDTGGPPVPAALFAENDNQLCYVAGGAGGCHQMLPINYPATESSRIPAGFPDAGYFEHNSGGSKVYGVEYRNRWPGESVYESAAVAGMGPRYVSPHRNDPDMPRLDAQGGGSCFNCHYPHGSDNPFDMLVDNYRGIGGATESTYPSQYRLCFNCHSTFGPPGMESTGRQIADYYDTTINPDDRAGHQIRMDPDVAISWPAHIRKGDKLPCYDCHNPHGSRGYNGAGANAFLISDERPGWANLTDTKTDPAQSRLFCLGCHIPSDGAPGSRQVEGIVMNAIPDREGHQSTSFQGCFECHGSDYSSPNSENVHHPGEGG